MEKKFDAVIEAGQLADMSNTKQSRDVSNYYLNSVSINPELPVMSYGLQLDRLAEAPPTNLVDTESQLKNQYDILGKSGYVFKKQNEMHSDSSSHQNEFTTNTLTQPPLPKQEHVKEFFNPISGRDFNKFSKKSCDDMNIWRDDVTTVSAPIPIRFEHIDTRAQFKDKIDACTSTK